MRLTSTGSDNASTVNLTDSHATAVFREPPDIDRRGGPRPRTAAEKVVHFWSKVNRASDGCWLWTGATFRNGYGMFNAGRVSGGRQDTRYAHKTAYELTHGVVPKGYVVMHSCDVKACCNPAHLSAGTQAENVQQGVERRRA